MKQNSKGITKIVVYTIFVLLVGVLIAYGIVYKFPKLFKETVTRIEKDVTVTDEGIADAVEKVFDSVVVISTYKNDDLVASGSGFIYKIDDQVTYVITNFHVINEGNNYKISYSDGEVVDAKVLGGDQYTDIAVLKINTKKEAKEVSIGKTENLRIGDTTFTVGAPLADVYSWTVTRGIISGKERLVEVSVDSTVKTDYVMNAIQTDAAVNNGNSGGPLCNSNGDVIGVISAKISRTGVEGIGLAIPIEIAKEKAEQIINGKESEYPYLGVSMVSIDEISSYPQYYRYISDYKITTGVMIIDVEKNSSAEQSKLKTGDVIIKINDAKVSNVAFLRYELYKHKVGDTVKITYIRDGKENNVSVKLSSKLPRG